MLGNWLGLRLQSVYLMQRSLAANKMLIAFSAWNKLIFTYA
ncbi:hypothetical protein imdm_631 [gamma proteobacterium IMCC2047]|nr:hypothetical protein imdm_631 [gamma proteobacterium IMCC2047]